MPMPSLLKYFAFVGTALLAMITLANFLLDPSTGATVVASQAKVIPVQHDPRASKVERWRNEQAALKAATQTQTAENASLVTKSELAPPPRQQAVVIEPAQPVSQPAQVQPAQAQPAQAEPALQTADVSAEHDTEAARAAELARVKAEKVKAAKAAKAARQAKVARDRARADQLAQGGQGPQQGPQQGWQQGQNQFFSGAQQRTASNQQDQFYYGQRAPAPQQGPGNAYAPRPSYGPFGAVGRGW